MGLFNRLGRKVEELRQQAEGAKEGKASHKCANCEELFYTDHETCPECDSDAVVSIER